LIWQNPNFITREDVGIAYRKAKADLFYERGHVNAFALSEYEDNLSPNLEALYQHLQLNSLEWMTSQTFCGDWSVISKAMMGSTKNQNGTRPTQIRSGGYTLKS